MKFRTAPTLQPEKIIPSPDSKTLRVSVASARFDPITNSKSARVGAVFQKSAIRDRPSSPFLRDKEPPLLQRSANVSELAASWKHTMHIPSCGSQISVITQHYNSTVVGREDSNGKPMVLQQTRPASASASIRVIDILRQQLQPEESVSDASLPHARSGSRIRPATAHGLLPSRSGLNLSSSQTIPRAGSMALTSSAGGGKTVMMADQIDNIIGRVSRSKTYIYYRSAPLPSFFSLSLSLSLQEQQKLFWQNSTEMQQTLEQE